MKFHAISHNFVLIKQLNNIVLARCTCCSTPRFAVFAVNKSDRMFWYHGLDREEAERTFSFLVKRQAQVQQIQ